MLSNVGALDDLTLRSHCGQNKADTGEMVIHGWTVCLPQLAKAVTQRELCSLCIYKDCCIHRRRYVLESTRKDTIAANHKNTRLVLNQQHQFTFVAERAADKPSSPCTNLITCSARRRCAVLGWYDCCCMSFCSVSICSNGRKVSILRYLQSHQFGNPAGSLSTGITAQHDTF